MTHCNIQAIRVTLNVIGGKWKPGILWLISHRPYRFNELLRSIPNITKKMLVEHLKQLEDDGVVYRQVFEGLPARVEYSLTTYGETLIPIFKLMNTWGQTHLQSDN